MTGRIAAAACSLVLATVILCVVTFMGDPDNSLHTSAQSWAFLTWWGILGGLGVSGLAPMFPWFRRD